jgi:hypothetical protein
MHLILLLLFLWSFQHQEVFAQVALKKFPPIVPGLSDTCISVINQEIACNDSILWAGADGRFESDDTLSGLCTTACANALSTWQRRVLGACGSSRYETANGWAVLATLWPELALEDHNRVCLKSS